MNAYPNIIKITSLIGDPTRATMLDALLNGQSLPAGQLAYIAGVTPQTASSHLAKLVEGNLITVDHQGRHRYYRLASAEVAQVMEIISTMAPPVPVRSLRESEELKKVRHARTCYDHLAGRLGVSLTEALLTNGFITVESDTDYGVSEKGKQRFRDFGIDLSTMKPGRRVFAKRCLDWSERYHHLGGFLGATITSHLFERGWIKRIERTRAVTMTTDGRNGFNQYFGLIMDNKMEKA